MSFASSSVKGERSPCTHLTLHFPQLLFPPQRDSIPTPISLEASRTVFPPGISPLLPEGRKITWNIFISNDSFRSAFIKFYRKFTRRSQSKIPLIFPRIRE